VTNKIFPFLDQWPREKQVCVSTLVTPQIVRESITKWKLLLSLSLSSMTFFFFGRLFLVSLVCIVLVFSYIFNLTNEVDPFLDIGSSSFSLIVKKTIIK
jgi:hypothetical protein